MKKRILSLILAFAMAATLAPATALVGTSVSKAAVASATASSTTVEVAKDSYAEVIITVAKESADTITLTSNSASLTGITVEGLDSTIDGSTATSSKYKVKISAGSTATAEQDLVFTATDASSGTKTATVKVKATNGFVTAVNGADVAATATLTEANITVERDVTKGEFTLKITPPNDKDYKNITLKPVASYDGNRLSNPIYTFASDKKSATFKITGVDKTKPGVYEYTWASTYSNGTAGPGGKINIEITPKFKATYKTGGGEINALVPVSENTYESWTNGSSVLSIVGDSDIIRPGYIFDGWTRNGTKIPVSTSSETLSADTVYTANWISKEEDLVLHANGGESVQHGTETDIYIGAKIGSSLPTNVFKRDGYKFVGWTSVSGGNIVEISSGAAITEALLKKADGDLYAVWRGDAFKVTFDANVPEDGKLAPQSGSMSSLSYETDMGSIIDPVADPGPGSFRNKYAVIGYSFEGWATDKDGYNRIGDDISRGSINPDGLSAVTLYATWSPNTRTVVVYNLGVKEPGNSIRVVVNETDFNNITNMPAKVGYNLDRSNPQWTYADGSLVESDIKYDDNGVAVVYPVLVPSEIEIEYKDEASGNVLEIGENTISPRTVKLTGYRRTKVTVDTGAISLPTATEAFKSIKGWQIKELVEMTDGTTQAERELAYAMSKGGFDPAALYTSSINIGEVYKKAAAYGVEFPSDITLELVTMKTAAGAKMANAHYKDGGSVTDSTTATRYEYDTPFAYGVSIADVEKTLNDEVIIVTSDSSSVGGGKSIYDGTATETFGVAGLKVVWTSSPTFNGTPKNTAGTYNMTGRVYASASVYGNGGSVSPIGTVYAKIKVEAKDPTSSDIYITSVTKPNDIKLAGEASVEDIQAAVQAITNTTVKADNGKSYVVPFEDVTAILSIKGSDGSDYTFATTSSDPGDDIASALAAGITEFTVTYDLQDNAADTTPLQRSTALEKVSVKIIIGENSKEDSDKEDEITEELSKAETLLAEGYALRVFNPIDGNHYYYTTINELKTLLSIGCKHEVDRTAQFKASNTKNATFDRAVYRLSTKNAGGAIHYTADATERDNLVKLGWTWDKANYNDDGAIFYVSGNSNGGKIYRLRNGKMHHFALQKERDSLMKKNIGWVDETGNLAADKVWYNAN